MKEKILPLTLIFLLLVFGFSESIRMTLNPGRVIIKLNVSKEEPGKYTQPITVYNKNNYTVNITVKAVGNITEFVDLKSMNFVLQPNESERVYCNFTVDKVK